MAEAFSSANLEAEIAELNREIKAKRELLEKEHGVVSEKEAFAATVEQELRPEQAVAVKPEAAAILTREGVRPGRPAGPAKSYLDTLDPESVAVVNDLVSLIPTKGLKHVLKRARELSPFLLDAIHDALVDKLYEELRKQGLFK